MDLVEKYLGEAEKKWAYGTRDKKWHLVGPEDRDYKTAISKSEFKKLGKEKAKKKYLSPSFVGEGQIPTIDYKKVGPNDWIIYDEGTGTIQKIVKNKANRKIDATKHFVSSKSAGVKASYAATKMSWLFLKKNKGFSDLIKTVKNNDKKNADSLRTNFKH